MMEAAGEVHRPPHPAGTDRVDRAEGAADDPGGGPVHPGEGRDVVPADPEAEQLVELLGRHLLERSRGRSTASMYAGSCTRASWSSLATGAGRISTPGRSSSPAVRASSRVRVRRIGAIGWKGPKSYSHSASSHTIPV